jgi:uncharacterized protein involved in type VI secretion and phage assembly
MISRIDGIIPAVVKELEDPQGEGRFLVEFSWMGGRNVSYWAPMATLMAGNGKGTWFPPAKGDEVFVAFDRGQVDHPIIVGYAWNGVDRPPSTHPRDHLIYTQNGHYIRFLDATPDAGSLGGIIIRDAHGNMITLSNGKISIKGVGVLEFEAPIITLNGRVVSPNPNPI